MTIQIELNPEIMERLAAEAAAHGIALGVCGTPAARGDCHPCGASGQLSVAELHAMLNAIAEGSEKLPKVPTSAFTRESFYEERR